jgi:hypothetical protein
LWSIGVGVGESVRLDALVTCLAVVRDVAIGRIGLAAAVVR